MASLPRHRLETFSHPFTNLGVDYFGPILVSVNRRTVKRWGMLCTCLVTRAVHIEVVHSLDTDSFLMGYERFVGRRGRPAVVYSDNGTQFVAGERELRENLAKLDVVKIHDHLSAKGTEWHFSPPAAPHFGGVWESLVRSAKVALKKIVGVRTLSDEVLLTVLVEVEALLNARPPTHVSVDPRDPEPLTPNHFLLGRASPATSLAAVDDDEISSRRRWRAAQVLVNHFWRRWVKEFLPTIIQRHKWLIPTRNLQAEDIVLIADPNSPRGLWPVGRVVRTIPSQDGVIRSVIVKTKTGEYQRPVAKLCLLKQDVFEPESKTGPAVRNGAQI